MIYLFFVIAFFSIVYLVGSYFVTIFKIEIIFNKNLLIVGAFCYFILILLAGIAIIDRDKFKTELEKKPEKYELIQEPIYRKIK